MTTVDPAGRSEFDDRAVRWAARLGALTFTNAQAEGFECVAGCGYDQLRNPDPGRSMLPVGFGPRGQVFACSTCDDADRAAQRLTPDAVASEDLAARADEILAAHALLADQATRGAVRMYDRMAGAILRHGLSLSELADLSGIAHHHLTAVLDGDEELSVTELLLVAGVLGVEVGAWFAQAHTVGGDQ